MRNPLEPLSLSDEECVAFLQYALPRLNLRWAGFRKVRGQVNKRLKRRIKELGLEGLTAYRSYLEEDPEEWRRLDEFCRITISRFYRDRGVFQLLQDRVLPELAERAADEGRSVIRVWSAGCASGEEVYTLRILWDLTTFPRLPARNYRHGCRHGHADPRRHRLLRGVEPEGTSAGAHLRCIRA